MTFVYRIGHLGDSLVAIPAVTALAGAFPGEELVLITNAPQRNEMVTAWDVFKHTGVFRDVIFYRPTVGSLLDLAARLRANATKKRLYYLPPARSAAQRRRDSWFFRRVCGFERILGLGQSGEWPIHGANGTLLRREPEYLRLFRGVCDELHVAPPLPEPPLLDVPEAPRLRATELLATAGGSRLVGMGIGTKMQSKRWFLDRYVAVARHILDGFPECAIVLMGGAEDRSDGEDVAAALRCDRVLNLAGATDIIESAAVASRCSLFVGNDTGTMHLAAAMGTPCIVVSSARDNPGLWEPYGSYHQTIRKDVPCAGCRLTECREQGRKCMDLITADEVSREVLGALAQK